jgi:hypothetical protein
MAAAEQYLPNELLSLVVEEADDKTRGNLSKTSVAWHRAALIPHRAAEAAFRARAATIMTSLTAPEATDELSGTFIDALCSHLEANGRMRGITAPINIPKPLISSFISSRLHYSLNNWPRLRRILMAVFCASDDTRIDCLMFGKDIGCVALIIGDQRLEIWPTSSEHAFNFCINPDENDRIFAHPNDPAVVNTRNEDWMEDLGDLYLRGLDDAIDLRYWATIDDTKAALGFIFDEMFSDTNGWFNEMPNPNPNPVGGDDDDDDDDDDEEFPLLRWPYWTADRLADLILAATGVFGYVKVDDDDDILTIHNAFTDRAH